MSATEGRSAVDTCLVVEDHGVGKLGLSQGVEERISRGGVLRVAGSGRGHSGNEHRRARTAS